jgi:hypothetical protein
MRVSHATEKCRAVRYRHWKVPACSFLTERLPTSLTHRTYISSGRRYLDCMPRLTQEAEVRRHAVVSGRLDAPTARTARCRPGAHMNYMLDLHPSRIPYGSTMVAALRPLLPETPRIQMTLYTLILTHRTSQPSYSHATEVLLPKERGR